MMISDIGFTARFVPFSLSRNSGKRVLSLNWRITLTYNGDNLTVEYMQGIGHVPGFTGTRTLYDEERNTSFAERGAYKGVKLKPPELRDVLECLLLDCDILNHACFEDWAEDTGYNPDSRADERVYLDCLSQSLKLRKIFGPSGLAKLREELNND